MSITTVLFDLDGTLLPMDQQVFVKDYFGRIAARLAPQGYEPQKLVDTIWRGTGVMVKNDGSRTNEQAFWDFAVSVYGDKIVQDKPFFDDFYETEFDKVKAVCGFQPAAREIVHGLKERGCRTVLATNPIFPARATQWRIQWAGLQPEDFELYTTYENSRYCKPDLRYYQEILEKQGLRAEECLMVGNDVGEDMIAARLGMQVFLLTDCLINTAGTDISAYPHGDFDELRKFLDALCPEKH